MSDTKKHKPGDFGREGRLIRWAKLKQARILAEEAEKEKRDRQETDNGL